MEIRIWVGQMKHQETMHFDALRLNSRTKRDWKDVEEEAPELPEGSTLREGTGMTTVTLSQGCPA